MSQDKTKIKVPLMADLAAENKKPDFLFWVGSAGSYDDRAKKISKAFVKILHFMDANYAILGAEETDTGESAKRAGSEFIYQMQAVQNIEVLNTYEIKQIVTCDPHDYSILKNEYADLGGKYEVKHHSQYLRLMIEAGKLKLPKEVFKGKRITYHDPCYLGRGNGEYEASRFVLNQLGADFTEMERYKERALCCGAGGAQMFKEAEKGSKEIFEERTQDAINVNPDVICTACPYCMTMLTDGVKYKDKQDQIKVLDLAEIIAESLGL